jgi:hypothetical protein
MSMLIVLLLLLLLVGSACAVQFLIANHHVGSEFSPLASIAVDFTVYSPIMVTSIGFIDADASGISGTLLATIADRSNNRFFYTLSASFGDTRENDENPFYFANVSFRLEPGAYSVISTGFNVDKIITTNVTTGYDKNTVQVLATRGLRGRNANLTAPLTVDVGGAGYFQVGATFTYEVLPVMPVMPSVPATNFVDCEAVACRGLPTGYYYVLGIVRFCDNGAAGGGWLRVWRANDSTCEAQGWSSARNINATGVDPPGCSPSEVSGGCSNSTRIESPIPIHEVRGAHWRVSGLGALDAFHSRSLCDGVVVWGRSSADVMLWALAMSGSASSGRCPCDPAFVPSNLTIANLNAAGSNWFCTRLPLGSSGWNRALSSASCSSNVSSNVDSTTFTRAFDQALTSLRVGLCKNAKISISSDIKLESGDLFVRSTAGFDRRQNCGTVSTSVVPMSTSATSSAGSPSTGSLPSSGSGPSTDSVPTATPLMSSMQMSTMQFSVGSVSTSPADGNWLVPVVGGSVGGAFLLLLIVVVAAVCWKRRSVASPAPIMPAASGTPTTTPTFTCEYGAFPQSTSDNYHKYEYDDVTDVQRSVSNYEAATTPLGK